MASGIFLLKVNIVKIKRSTDLCVYLFSNMHISTNLFGNGAMLRADVYCLKQPRFENQAMWIWIIWCDCIFLRCLKIFFLINNKYFLVRTLGYSRYAPVKLVWGEQSQPQNGTWQLSIKKQEPTNGYLKTNRGERECGFPMIRECWQSSCTGRAAASSGLAVR